MASEIPTGFLTVRAGTFQRSSRASREGDVRQVSISNCPVTSWSVMGEDTDDNKLDGRSFGIDEQLLVYIREMKSLGNLFEGGHPEKIGGLNTESMLAFAYVPPNSFAHFWMAAEATDGSTRHIDLELGPGPRNVLSVTNVGLIESMTGSHPVVAELRVMREKLSRRAGPIIVAFWIVVVIWVLFKIFR